MVDLTAHRVVWRYQHPQRKFPFYSSAAVTGDRVVVGGRDKFIHGLDRTGKRRGLTGLERVWSRRRRSLLDECLLVRMMEASMCSTRPGACCGNSIPARRFPPHRR